jgi:hypothetical protein
MTKRNRESARQGDSPYDRTLRSELQRRHLRQGQSLEVIAAHYKVSVVDITRQFRRLGVPIRGAMVRAMKK